MKEKEVFVDILDDVFEGVEVLKGEDANYYIRSPYYTKGTYIKVGTEEFEKFFTQELVEVEERIPSDGDVKKAVLYLKTKQQGEPVPVYSRVAYIDNEVLINVCDGTGLILLVNGEEITNVYDTDALFVTYAGMSPLTLPARRGNLDLLWKYTCNIDEKGRLLVLAWLIMTFFEGRATPILFLLGAPGSGKTTLAKMLRQLVDPSAVPHQNFSNSERDLMIAAKNSSILGFDNIRSISNEMSDVLCRLVTGGGYRVRKLYTDSDESIFFVMKPIMITGLSGLVRQPDLGSRSIQIQATPFEDGERLTESELLENFYKDQPKIYRGLLELLQVVLKDLPTLTMGNLPRLSDYAKVGEVCGRALGYKEGDFLAMLEGNQEEIIIESIEEDPVVKFLSGFLKNGEEWVGTASELLEKMTRKVDCKTNASSLSSKLRSLVPALKVKGINLEFDLNIEKRKRCIKIIKEASQFDVERPQRPPRPSRTADLSFLDEEKKE